MDLSQFKVKAHPTKAIFQEHKIPLGSISRFLGITYNYCSTILNGHIKPTEEVDQKLNELARQLEAEGTEGGS